MNSVQRLAQGPWRRGLYDVLVRENGIEHQVVDIVRTSRVLTYLLALRSTRDLQRLTVERMEEQVALALGVEAVRVSRQLGRVAVEVQLPGEFHRPLLVRALRRKGKSWLTLGQMARGHQVHVNVGGSRYTHALVVATTGGGKTFALRLVVWELAMQNGPEDVWILVIDGKGGRDWADFAGLPHLVHPVVGGRGEEALGALAWVLQEVERREKLGYVRPMLFVVVDEVAELLERSGGGSGLVAKALQRLTQVGRGLGIRVWVATQHPTRDVLGGSLMKANLPLRLVGRVVDAGASNLATGQAGMRAHRLYGAGDFLAVDGGQAHRFQVAVVDERHVARLPRRDGGPRRVDLSLDLGRAVDVAGGEAEDLSLARMAAWACWDMCRRSLANPSATALRQAFGVGTERARKVRDRVALWLEEFEGGATGLLATGEGVSRARGGVLVGR